MATKRPDDRTIEALSRVSLQDELWEGNHIVEQGRATIALATLGRHRDVVQSMVKWGLDTFSVVTDPGVLESGPDDGAVRTCLDAISSGTQAPPGALLALGVYGSAEHTERIRAVLATASPASEPAKACVIAIGLLRDRSKEAVDRISEHLTIPGHRHAARVALLRIGTDHTKAALLVHLEANYDVELAVDLMNSPTTATRAIELTRAYLSSADPFDWSRAVNTLVRWIDDDRVLLSVTAESRLLEHLHDVAFADEGRGWLSGSKAAAILGVARFDPRTAFLAARKTLRNPSSHDREYYPNILVEIDADAATPELLAQAAEERSTAVIWAIGRALADADVSDQIEQWIGNSDAKKRLAACRVCARFGPGDTVFRSLRARLDDIDLHVADAAREALHLLQVANEADALVEAVLAEDNASRRWVLLDSLLALADPGDIHRPWPKWAREIAENVAYLMRVYIEDELKERRKEVAREAEKRDR